MVESIDQVILCMDQTQLSIVKGKRTKRQRTPSLLTLSMACSSSTTVLEDEEEDMANCLMLLAQGHTTKQSIYSSSDHPMESSYRCKTCNRSFSTFQALGGHRAGHRKPKASNVDDEKVVIISGEGDRVNQIVNRSTPTTLSLQMPTRVLNGGGKSKLHECAICGAEFTSGQALGGHMRRHRTVISAAPITIVGAGSTTSISFEIPETKKLKTGLRLDLNLPAPEDRESSVQSLSAPKQQVIVFSASTLIDCYY